MDEANRDYSYDNLSIEQQNIVRDEFIAYKTDEVMQSLLSDGGIEIPKDRLDNVRAQVILDANDQWERLTGHQRSELADASGFVASGKPSWAIDGDNSRVRMIAREMVTRRTEDLLEEAGLGDGGPGPSTYAEKVWGGWKESSTSQMGLALQVATARELGGVHRLTEHQIGRASCRERV